jgi:hypothetical protein
VLSVFKSTVGSWQNHPTELVEINRLCLARLLFATQILSQDRTHESRSLMSIVKLKVRISNLVRH